MTNEEFIDKWEGRKSRCANVCTRHTGDELNTALGLHYKEEYGDDFLMDLAEKDEMLETDQFRGLQGYLSVGERILESIERVLVDAGRKWEEIDSFLDFAAGYGRGTRFLVHQMDREKITVSEINHDAVDWAHEKLGVKGFYSTHHAADLKHDQTYDIIYVVSLFTHLNPADWTEWLKKLHSMLNEGGLLVISTHPAETHLGWSEKSTPENPDGGYAFSAGGNETRGRLEGSYYGCVHNTYGYVEHVVTENQLGRIAANYDRLLNNHHDIFVIEKSGKAGHCGRLGVDYTIS